MSSQLNFKRRIELPAHDKKDRKMNIIRMVSILKRVISLGLVFWLVAFASATLSSEQQNNNAVNRYKNIKGIAVTGDNNLFQEPIWDMGPPFHTTFFNWTFAYNPNDTEPLLITKDMPGNTILAGGVDPVALSLGLLPNDVDSSLINVPLHKTPVTVGLNGRGIGTKNRKQLPSTLEVGTASIATRANPNEPVTIDKWYRAEGDLKIVCHANGTAKADFSLRNLIPNGVYSLWSISGIEVDGKPNIAPYPFGGVPNILIPDHQGHAVVSRTLGYCPLTDKSLVFVDVAFHSDGNVYGSVPDAPFDDFSQPMGTVTHTHVQFPINVVKRIHQ